MKEEQIKQEINKVVLQTEQDINEIEDLAKNKNVYLRIETCLSFEDWLLQGGC